MAKAKVNNLKISGQAVFRLEACHCEMNTQRSGATALLVPSQPGKPGEAPVHPADRLDLSMLVLRNLH